jgi:voltage-gated potassium channel Kch
MRFLYFSYVTMTTLGYGDITPIAPIARSLAMLEALIGQIYLVVMIAWLVGMNVSQSLGKNDSSEK